MSDSEKILSFKIKTAAELSGVEDAIKKLEKATAAGKALGQEETERFRQQAAQLDRARAAVAAYHDEVRKTPPAPAPGQSGGGGPTAAGALHTIGSLAGAAGLGDIAGIAGVAGAAGGGAGALATAAITKLIGTFKEFVDAAAHAELSQVNLDAALRNAGELIPEVRSQYNTLAAALKEDTGLGFKSALATLEEFGANRANIDASAEAVKNLAGYTNDAESAAVMYGKALGGNFAAFSRLGIQIDENLSQAEKLKRLNDALANMFGGILEAKARTTAGELHRLGEEWERLYVTLGQTSQVREWVETLGNKIAWLADHFKKSIPPQKELLDGLNRLPRSFEDAEAAAYRLAKAAEARANADAASLVVLKDLDAEETRRAADQDAIARAETARAKARIDAAVQTGHMTKEQGDAAKGQVDAQAQEAQFAREQQRDAQKIANAEKRQKQLEAEAATAKKTLADLEAQDKAAAQYNAQRAVKEKLWQDKLLADRLLEDANKNASVMHEVLGPGPETEDERKHREILGLERPATHFEPDPAAVRQQKLAQQSADYYDAEYEKQKSAFNALPIHKAAPTGGELNTAREEYKKFFNPDGTAKITSEIHQMVEEIKGLRADMTRRESVQEVTRKTRAEAREPALVGDIEALKRLPTGPRQSPEDARNILRDMQRVITQERDEATASVPQGPNHSAAVAEIIKKANAELSALSAAIQDGHALTVDQLKKLVGIAEKQTTNQEALDARIDALDGRVDTLGSRLDNLRNR